VQRRVPVAILLGENVGCEKAASTSPIALLADQIVGERLATSFVASSLSPERPFQKLSKSSFAEASQFALSKLALGSVWPRAWVASDAEASSSGSARIPQL